MWNELADIYEAFSPELRLLLVCLKRQITEIEQEALDVSAVGHINWDYFVHLTVYHGVYPLVYQYFNAFKSTPLPDEVVSALRQKLWENTSKSLQMMGDLVKVLRTMEERGIRTVVLKGFPLAHKLYGNMALRPSHDLDILVWPKDVDEARKVIEELGYDRIYPNFAATPGQLRSWMKIQHHFNYLHENKQILLELHWQLGHHGMDIPLTYLKDSLTQVKIAGQSMYVLRTEELLLSLVMHGASHKWFRLKWLCDIGMMLKQGDFSWQRLYQLSESLGVKTLLNQAVILSRYLLEAPVPASVVEAVTKDRKAHNLASLAIPFIITFHSGLYPSINMPSYYHQKKYGFHLRCGWRRKFALLHDHFLPTDADIKFIALPDCLYSMYYLLRPFTWFGRRFAQWSGK